jgi:hypothetical protein
MSNRRNIVIFIITAVLLIAIYLILIFHLNTPNFTVIYNYIVDKTLAVDSVTIISAPTNDDGIIISVFVHSNLSIPIILDSVRAFDPIVMRQWKVDYANLRDMDDNIIFNHVISRHQQYYFNLYVYDAKIEPIRAGIVNQPLNILIYSHHSSITSFLYKSTATNYLLPLINIDDKKSRINSFKERKMYRTFHPMYYLDTLETWSVFQRGNTTVSKNQLYEQVDTIFIDKHDKVMDEDSSLTQSEYITESHHLFSLIGPFLSYEYFCKHSDGYSTTIERNYNTLDLRTKENIALSDLFPDEEIKQALLRDTSILTYISSSDTTSLRSILVGLNRDIDFYGILNHFHFNKVYNDSIIIELGITHSCELRNGNFTSFNLRMPVPRKLLTFAKRISFY